LRHRLSRKYLRDGGWTKDADKARDFQNIREVVETCLEQQLEEVDLVLRFDGTSLEITIRIR
jgi:hypothetical protein